MSLIFTFNALQMDSTGCDKSRTNAEVDRIFFHLHYIVLPSFLVTLILASERNVLYRWTHSLFFFAFLVYLPYSLWTHQSQHRIGWGLPWYRSIGMEVAILE
ncbi:hypothetical protein DFH05DRAFT_1500334 [Lentinula detonsa]|uniref:Uncharacterized protein n=1 Tax=Lentinula detonsa TaxID=2804962 RepID=A0A9W8NWM0_9AGAR|nr:hypothetical protein DFH05DRAFT_1500334 [Lentinula detonsa]